MVVRSLRRRTPGLETVVVTMKTHGDRSQRPGSSPDFTGALEEALREGAIDLAVHSAKDLMAADPPGLHIAAYPRRADPRDCFIAQEGLLRSRAHIGSSSLRRRAQLLRWRPDLRIQDIRGNVDTRIRSVQDRTLDAVIVAKAGVDRLGRSAEISGILPTERFLPAPGQGALAVQVRARDRSTRALVRKVDHPPTRAAVQAERALARALAASCNVPLGALATVRGRRLSLRAEVLSCDGTRSVRASRTGRIDRPEELGRELARDLTRAGARSLIEEAP
jgi:hydroxymethylbilane synthase